MESKEEPVIDEVELGDYSNYKLMPLSVYTIHFHTYFV